MKAATGELNLTVITLIAIAAVIGFFWIMWPNIQKSNGKTFLVIIKNQVILLLNIIDKRWCR